MQKCDKFICKNNRFPYGRYNVRSDNPKLFSYVNGNLTDTKNSFVNTKIKTGSNCAKHNMLASNKKSGLLFKNTNVLSEKQIFSMLSRGSRRPFR